MGKSIRRITLRGDTDFTQTRHLDRWDEDGVRFVFGIDARSNLKGLAEDLPDGAYGVLERPARYTIKTTPRGAREDHKTPIVIARLFETTRLKGEEVAEFDYRPVACRKSYRVVVPRKRLSREKGELVLFEDYRYFFYITNDRTASAAEVVFDANDRCDQENLIARLKGGVKAMAMPVGDTVSNGAYMVMAGLAWSLKAWAALLLPEHGRWAERHRAEKRSLLRMEFSTFCVAMIRSLARSCVVPGGWCSGCCRGTRGRACSSGWWSGCTDVGCVEPIGDMKPESGCSGPCGRRTDERRCGDEGTRPGGWEPGGDGPARGGCVTIPGR